ncbi:MAG: SDR family oxidoreductase [Candidatus Hydrogenedentes bacterium]|nr:SDR family oxidoreductase [Candidatus Hydrogenedentota bacterium]
MIKSIDMFRLDGRTAVVLGGGGVLGKTIAEGLAGAGARVAICDYNADSLDAATQPITDAGGEARGYQVNALEKADLERLQGEITNDLGRVDILVSAVGGNMKGATTSPEQSFFDLDMDAIERVVALNLYAGAILPAQVFGRAMVENPDGGSIINVSSMNALRPLTRIPGYSAAKAAVSNFTQWLSTHIAQEYSRTLRVNAIAPGFFLTEQNRFLLTDADSGELTDRGKTIIAHTPMNKFGSPEDLVGACIWLASDASSFVSGIVLPIDGGFSAFSGV